MDNMAGASEGMKKYPREFRAAAETAARQTKRRNGASCRVSWMVSWNLAGSVFSNPWAAARQHHAQNGEEFLEEGPGFRLLVPS
jgi:hypothetical protein